MTRAPIATAQPGDVILPPARELALWMRRACAEKGLPESALYLTVRETRETNPDKRGRWLLVKCDQADEWTGTARRLSFNFKARPETVWPFVQRVTP